MRLLDTRTGEFVWVNDPMILRFAIISHVWSADGEQPYQDLLRVQDDVRIERALNPDLPTDIILQRASPKIRDCCAYALADGFDFLWIDSCCIDKTSSAELSEAINSMYTWYSLSTLCYAFLQDVDSDEDPRLPLSAFRRSRWHTRGWTLQELIAPRVVVFVSATWRSLGTKGQLADVIEEVTGVDRGVLLHTTPLTSVTVARRMSWAARRVTTRKEDEAYSLMGIFGVNMPAIYGEGALAFGRLQEEILKQVPDQTIFVWDTGHSSLDADEYDGSRSSLLAASPAAFAHSAGVTVISRDELLRRVHATSPSPWYMPTSRGLRTSFPLLTIGAPYSLAFLACVDEHDHLLALVLKKSPEGEIHSVGTVGWNAVRARYRSMLRSSTWGPLAGGTSPMRDTLGGEQYTRIVRVLRCPGGITAVEVVVAHRPSLPSDRDTTAIVIRGTLSMEPAPSWQGLRSYTLVEDFSTAVLCLFYWLALFVITFLVLLVLWKVAGLRFQRERVPRLIRPPYLWPPYI